MSMLYPSGRKTPINLNWFESAPGRVVLASRDALSWAPVEMVLQRAPAVKHSSRGFLERTRELDPTNGYAPLIDGIPCRSADSKICSDKPTPPPAYLVHRRAFVLGDARMDPAAGFMAFQWRDRRKISADHGCARAGVVNMVFITPSPAAGVAFP